MRILGPAPDLVAGGDGAYVVCGGPRLTLYDAATRARVAVADEPIGLQAELALLGPTRLLALVPGAERTQLLGFALPSLERLATLELEGRLRLLAATASRALVATESMEQPRVVAVTTKILVEPIGMREPLLLATAAPEERLLVAARTREAQLECWDPLVRRALYRLNLPLMPRAERAGFSSRRRLLWIASPSPQGGLDVFRFSDGRLQARAELGAPIVGAAGHPDSPRLVVATRAGEDQPVKLTELDFAQGERRELALPLVPAAYCVVEGAAPALVLHPGGEAEPTWVALGASLPEPTIQPTPRATPPAGRAPSPSAAAAASDWRARLGQGAAPAGAHPAANRTLPTRGRTAPEPASGEAAAATAANRPLPTRGRTAPEPASGEAAAATAARGDGERAAARRDGERAAASAAEPHWREVVYDWAAALLEAPAQASPTPPLAADTPAAGLIDRLALDERTARLVALLYGARLGGVDGLAAATVARALAGGAATAEADWAEALGRGRAATLGLVRARGGRLSLSAAAARLLDGAAPRVALLRGGAGTAELPRGRVRIDGGAEPLAAIGARLAERYGYDVALIPAEGATARRAVAARLAEARLHGAWPAIDAVADPAAWIDALDQGPLAIVVRGAPPPVLADLPTA